MITSVLLPFEASDPKDIVFSVLQIAKDTSTFDDYDQNKQSLLLALIGLMFHGALLFLITGLFWHAKALETSISRVVRVPSFPLLQNILLERLEELRSGVLGSLKLFRRIDVIALNLFAHYLQKLEESMSILPASTRISLESSMSGLIPDSFLSSILWWLLWLSLFAVGIVWNAWKVWNYLNRILPKQTLPCRRPKFHDRRIEPDYSKSLLDVWSGFIEYCIETSKSLDVICRRWSPTVEQRRNIPSWILPLKEQATSPKASQTRTENGMFACIPGRSRIYNASGRSSPSFKLGKKNTPQRTQPALPGTSRPGEYSRVQRFDIPRPPSFGERLLQIMRGAPQAIDTREEAESQFDGILHVEGIRIGTIDEVTLITNGILNHEILDILGFQENLVSTDAKFEQVWRTLVAARGPDGSEPLGWYSRACRACIEWYIKDPDDFVKRSTRRTSSGRLTRRVEFMERVQQVARNRKCFRSYVMEREGRHVGLAPPNAEAGDLICIFFGCSVPVVLRRKGENFTFVGECYVDGVMNGEAVLTGMKQREWFKIH